MGIVIAKFFVSGVNPNTDGLTGTVNLTPVYSHDPADRENSAFGKATPDGAVRLNLQNPAAFAAFKDQGGKEFYLPFIPADGISLEAAAAWAAQLAQTIATQAEAAIAQAEAEGASLVNQAVTAVEEAGAFVGGMLQAAGEAVEGAIGAVADALSPQDPAPVPTDWEGQEPADDQGAQGDDQEMGTATAQTPMTDEERERFAAAAEQNTASLEALQAAHPDPATIPPATPIEPGAIAPASSEAPATEEPAPEAPKSPEAPAADAEPVAGAGDDAGSDAPSAEPAAPVADAPAPVVDEPAAPAEAPAPVEPAADAAPVTEAPAEAPAPVDPSTAEAAPASPAAEAPASAPADTSTGSDAGSAADAGAADGGSAGE